MFYHYNNSSKLNKKYTAISFVHQTYFSFTHPRLWFLNQKRRTIALTSKMQNTVDKNLTRVNYMNANMQCCPNTKTAYDHYVSFIHQCKVFSKLKSREVETNMNVGTRYDLPYYALKQETDEAQYCKAVFLFGLIINGVMNLQCEMRFCVGILTLTLAYKTTIRTPLI